MSAKKSDTRDQNKERPILFNTDMVKAIMAGRKTETRRIAKVQPDMVETFPGSFGKSKHKAAIGPFVKYGECKSAEGSIEIEKQFTYCPYGKVGDLLWVREPFSELKRELIGKDHHDTYTTMVYKATCPIPWKGKWTPSIFMPKAAARIWLQVTDVRVESLQDITEEGAKNEGVEKGGKFYRNYNGAYEKGLTQFKFNLETKTALLSFQSLWKKINGGRSWEQNPYVWVVKYNVLSMTGKPDTWINKQLRVDEEAEKYTSA
jgi:hypothetical protein